MFPLGLTDLVVTVAGEADLSHRQGYELPETRDLNHPSLASSKLRLVFALL